MTRILLLGGTTEASALARRLADAGVDAIFSYAGRTESPVAQPLPTRVGGFGGVDGLAAYLRAERITHVIDATHPFAAGMSRNALAACTLTRTPICTLERAPWVVGPGDDWRAVADTAGAVAALPHDPTRIFLAIGKQTLADFAARPQHRYLLRLVDAPTAPLPLTDVTLILARGPFDEADDLALLQTYRIGLIVAKNAGGSGADAKLKAARTLGIPVILIDRPTLPARRVFTEIDDVLYWLSHPARLGL